MEVLIKKSRPEFLMEKAHAFKNVKVMKAWVEKPIHQVAKPYLTFILKGGDHVFTALSPVDTHGKSFVPVNLMQKMEELEVEGIQLDTLQIRPYNFPMHPEQRIHIRLSVA